jgi:hypothetical protein
VIKQIRIRYMGHAAHIGENRNVYRFLMGKPERKTLAWKT